MVSRRRIALSALGAAVGVEVVAAVIRQRMRSRMYDAAKAHARSLNRPLVVVGDPDAGASTALLRAYGCGDVCVDLNACPACPASQSVDLTRERARVADDSAVVFSSCVLEYVSDPDTAWRELLRMAGAPERVYLTTVQAWTGTAALYPGARWMVHRRGMTPPRFVPVSNKRSSAYAAVLASAATAALLPESSACELTLLLTDPPQERP